MVDPLKIHKALADETRLRLVRLLFQGPLNVNEIIDVLHMGQSRISRHLKILAEAELVSNRREGTWVYYHVNDHSVGNLTSEMLDLLRRHEHDLPFHDEDLQGLEGVVERRHAQSRDFFNKVEDPHQLHQGLQQNGDSYRQIAMSLMQERHRTVLDLGTGAGLLLPRLLENAEQVIAVDSSTKMLDMARHTAGNQAGRCDFRLGDLAHLPVANGEVEAVMACMVLHHVSNPAGTIAEAHRALKAGGELFIVDLRKHDDESFRESQADLWLGFEPAEIERWLRTNDFDLLDTDITGDTGSSHQLITFRGRKK